MKTLSAILVLIMATMLVIWGTGCQMAGPTESIAPGSDYVPQLIKLPGPKSLHKVIPVSQRITADSGGVLKLQYDNGSSLYHFAIDASLTFMPHAVNSDVTVTMSLDDSLVLLNFEPSMTFNIPAQLNVQATGLDLSGFATSSGFNLYWHDPITGAWVAMPAQAIVVTAAVSGTLACMNGQIPHFSVYAFGR